MYITCGALETKSTIPCSPQTYQQEPDFDSLQRNLFQPILSIRLRWGQVGPRENLGAHQKISPPIIIWENYFSDSTWNHSPSGVHIYWVARGSTHRVETRCRCCHRRSRTTIHRLWEGYYLRLFPIFLLIVALFDSGDDNGSRWKRLVLKSFIGLFDSGNGGCFDSGGGL